MSRKNSAGSSITDLVGVMPRCRFDGGSVPVWPFYELGPETFKAGEMVCLSGSAGSRVGVTKPGTNASGYGIIGFAADNASGFTSSIVGVFPATTETVFVGNIGHSVTSGSAQTDPIDVGQLYALTSLSGRTYVDKARTDTSAVMCRVIGFFDQDTVPSYYGRVYFQVLQHVQQLTNSVYLTTSSPVSMVV